MGSKNLISVLKCSLWIILCLILENGLSAQVSAYIPNSCFEMSGGTITRYRYDHSDCPTQQQETLDIPSYINWIRVTAIGDGAFNPAVLGGNEDSFSIFRFSNLYIPNWVTSIGKRAFQYNRFKYASIPNSVTSIGDYAFNRAFEGEMNWSSPWGGAPEFNAPHLSLWNGLKTIGKYAFSDNPFTDITIPDSVETIGDHAFNSAFFFDVYSRRSNSLTLWKWVKMIWDSAFKGNGLGWDLIIPNLVRNIGNNAFSDNQLFSVKILNSGAIIGDKAFFNNSASPFPVFQPWAAQGPRDDNIILNPLKVTIRCVNEKWNWLSNCWKELVGPTKSDFSTWTVATSGDYFKPGQTYTIIPAVLAGYSTPGNQSVTFPADPDGSSYTKTITFVYHKEEYCNKNLNPGIATGECQALAEFYSATRGENWKNKSWWSASLNLTNPVPVCSWYGISCDASGKVIKLSLPNNDLRGAWLGKLAPITSLQVLDLSQSQLNQQVPSNFYIIHPNLEVLRMSFAGLNGSLNFDGATKLKELDLSNNSFIGTIPASLANNRELRNVNLSDNYLVESISNALFNLETIKSFNISKNYIAGVKTNIFGNSTNRNQQRIVFANAKGTVITGAKLKDWESLTVLLKRQIYSNGRFIPWTKLSLDVVEESSNNITVVEKVVLNGNINYKIQLRSATNDGFFSVRLKKAGSGWEWTKAKVALFPDEGNPPTEENPGVSNPSRQNGENLNHQQGSGLHFELGGKYLDEYFSLVHFSVAGNDFWGGFFWLPVKKLETPVTVRTRDKNWNLSTKICENQVKGFYYNSQRGERLRPLDEESKQLLQRFSPGTYNDTLTLQWGWYTSCGDDPYGIYGAITHTYQGEEFHLNAGVAYDSSNNKMQTDGLKCNFQRLNNSYPFWYIYDDHGHIGFVGAKIREDALKNSARVDSFHNGLNQLLNDDMCISSVFNYDGREIWYSTTNPIPGFSTWNDINTFLDINPGSAKTTLFNLWIRGIVGLTDEFNNEEKKYFEGNTKDSTLLVRTDETISKVVNLTRKNAELLCRWKWQTTSFDLSKKLLCIQGDTWGSDVLRGSASSLAGKTVVAKNINLYLTPDQTSDSQPITLFIDKWNLLLPSSTNTGSMQAFDSFGYTISCADDQCSKANYLKGNFIINGLLLGGETGTEIISNKLYIHGKFVSFNTFKQPTDERLTTVENVLGSRWNPDFSSKIALDNLFSRWCNLDHGPDGTWCKGVSKAEREALGQSSVLIDKAFGLIDMDFANMLFR